MFEWHDGDGLMLGALPDEGGGTSKTFRSAWAVRDPREGSGWPAERHVLSHGEDDQLLCV